MKFPDMRAFARCWVLLTGLACLAHSPRAVKLAGRTAPGDEATVRVPAAVAPPTVATEQLLTGLAPEQERAIRAEVESAVTNATQEGAELVRDTTNEATLKWANEVDLVALQGRQQVQQSAEEDIEQVRNKAKTVEAEELKVVNKMNYDIEMAEEQVEGKVRNTSEKAAKSQTLNANAQAVASELGQIETEEGQMERERSETLVRGQAALQAAHQLEVVGQQADQISQNLNTSGPGSVAGQLLHEVNTSLAQAKHANTLANMSEQAIEREEARVRISDAEAEHIKAMTQTLLESATSEEVELKALEERAARVSLATEVHDAMS